MQRFVFMLVVMGWGVVALAGDSFEPTNTQAAGQHPLKPAEAVQRIEVPEGFTVTLAAAEPDVRQPVAIAYDGRGRLWVAETYSYRGSDFNDGSHDRVLIFDDTDGDGVFDSRKVFADGLNRLFGMTVGFGGVWIATPPDLKFIPDADGDDVPDAEPVVHLTGWTRKAEHNTVNGLTWGPDGWLYGRHGVKHASRVGRPGAPEDQRTELSCSIWRYHPTRHTFEVVTDGTINPWGLDFDDHGEAFLSTSVIEHLWHMVPGAHFERWKDRGSHPDPHVYELISATSDHLHWGGGRWDQAGRQAAGNAAYGGGHSHCDAMIYLGDRWPDAYRGSVFMSNIHGRRVNRDVFYREDDHGRYRARHTDDFLVVNDPWFRAVSLEYGPDGDVVMTDWSDNGECHDRDGIHRTSGRIYKISYGEPRHVEVDLPAMSDRELVELQLHRNDWYVRHARRLLQQRAVSGRDMTAAHEALRRMFDQQADVDRKLRAMWALYGAGGAKATWLSKQLDHDDEHVRAWAVRLLVDHGQPSDEAIAAMAKRAKRETSWLVQMHLAGALRKLAVSDRWAIAASLAGGQWVHDDANLARMVWYAIKGGAIEQADRAVELAEASTAGRLRQFVARRLTGEMDRHPQAASAVFSAMRRTDDADRLLDWLDGLNAALRESRPKQIPQAAGPLLRSLVQHDDPRIGRASITAAVVLGDRQTIDVVAALLHHSDVDDKTRRAALKGLLIRKPDRLGGDLRKLIQSGQLLDAALRAAGQVDDAKLARLILARYNMFSDEHKSLAIDALITRADTASMLLGKVVGGAIPARNITAPQARQIAALSDAKLTRRLEKHWGSLRSSSKQIRQLIAKWQKRLTPAALKQADRHNGQAVFTRLCATCHKLYGEGGAIGPDLTGSGRHDLTYLLDNIIDPGAVVPADFKLNVVTLKDGRVISGTIASKTDDTMTLQTPTDRVVVETANVQSTQTLDASLMPQGLIHTLSDDEFRDLIAYLMSDPE